MTDQTERDPYAAALEAVATIYARLLEARAVYQASQRRRFGFVQKWLEDARLVRDGVPPEAIRDAEAYGKAVIESELNSALAVDLRAHLQALPGLLAAVQRSMPEAGQGERGADIQAAILKNTHHLTQRCMNAIRARAMAVANNQAVATEPIQIEVEAPDVVRLTCPRCGPAHRLEAYGSGFRCWTCNFIIGRAEVLAASEGV